MLSQNNLDYFSQLHLAILLLLFPDESPAKLIISGIDIQSLVTEMNARILKLDAEKQSKKIIEENRKQSKKSALKQFIG